MLLAHELSFCTGNVQNLKRALFTGVQEFPNPTSPIAFKYFTLHPGPYKVGSFNQGLVFLKPHQDCISSITQHTDRATQVQKVLCVHVFNGSDKLHWYDHFRAGLLPSHKL